MVKRDSTSIAFVKPTNLGKMTEAAQKASASTVSNMAEERKKERMRALTRNLEVCDLLDIRNVQTVAEHAPKITTWLLSEEKKFMIPANFLQKTQITEKKRAFLIDWLVDFHVRFKMWAETFYVTIGIIDRYLSLTPEFDQSQLQCLGITAIFIAGKYEEIYPPDVKTILHVVKQAVSRDDLLRMEAKILTTL